MRELARLGLESTQFFLGGGVAARRSAIMQPGCFDQARFIFLKQGFEIAKTYDRAKPGDPDHVSRPYRRRLCGTIARL
ncbi:hypothetical protein ASE00_21190 [Sphingomonas sp. Root710]|nr:hypothetical protein ASE00_21190 [Sphingomonas sp. Root710]